ncbi:hypothetical protein HPP92_006990 [Vanilla planifolia]|uniref:Uncharacterized protein n=1 Tax=Vanilla planifolia TaxID=51239 RepID=A0A835RQH0_VANPL|nr:hypothetical protein HPP92_006990 [Vanilla planifolia]
MRIANSKLMQNKKGPNYGDRKPISTFKFCYRMEWIVAAMVYGYYRDDVEARLCIILVNIQMNGCSLRATVCNHGCQKTWKKTNISGEVGK